MPPNLDKSCSKIGMNSSSGRENGDELELGDKVYIGKTLVPVSISNRD
jgi:hypothetical protein